MKLLNSKILFITIGIAGLVAAILGIGQIWFGFLAWDIFIKSMVSIVLIGLMAGFVMAVDYSDNNNKSRLLLLSMIILALIMGVMILLQLWWLQLAWADFTKIFGTLVILFALVSFILAIKEDFSPDKKLKDENFLD